MKRTNKEKQPEKREGDATCDTILTECGEREFNIKLDRAGTTRLDSVADLRRKAVKDAEKYISEIRLDCGTRYWIDGEEVVFLGKAPGACGRTHFIFKASGGYKTTWTDISIKDCSITTIQPIPKARKKPEKVPNQSGETKKTNQFVNRLFGRR